METGLIVIFVICVLVGVWGVVVGLPLTCLYGVLKARSDNRFSELQSQYERRLRYLEKELARHGNSETTETAKTPTPAVPLSSREAGSKPVIAPRPVESEFRLTKIEPELPPRVSPGFPPMPFASSPVEPIASTPVEPEPPKKELPPIRKNAGEDTISPQASSVANPEAGSAARPVPVRNMEPEPVTDDLTALELQIGRKMIGWVAVALFALGGIFFVQLMISRGWLNPTNRFGGMMAFGAGLLIWGRYLVRVGWRRYSEMVNSAGVITLFSGAYYARWSGLFVSEITFALLVAVVLGGFLVSAYYRGMIVGYVATFGALAIPLLIGDEHPDFTMLAIYLSLVNVAVVMLVNLLGRSHLAVVSWLGTLALVIAVFPARGSMPVEANAELLFFLLFLTVYFADTCLAIFRYSRRMAYNDIFRALFTPIVFFFGARHALLAAEGTLWLGMTGPQWYMTLGHWTVLTLAVCHALTAVVAFRSNRRAGVVENRNGAMVAALSIPCFFFLGIFIPMAFGSSFVAVGWLILASAILSLSVNPYRLFMLSKVPNDVEGAAKRDVSFEPGAQWREAGYFQGWATLFFLLGVARLVVMDMIPYWAPVVAFETFGAIPLVHATALPVTCGALVLVAGMLVVLARYVRLAKETGAETPGINSIKKGLRPFLALGIVFGTVGLTLFTFHLCSEVYAYVVAFATRRAWTLPEIFGWGTVLYMTVALGLAAFLFGYARRNPYIRRGCMILLTVVALKTILIDLWSHPLVALWHLAILTPETEQSLPGVFLLGGQAIPHYPTPVLNPFILPLATCAAVLILVGIVARRGRTGTTGAVETRCGVALGVCGMALAWLIGSFETPAWFEYRPETFSTDSFYSLHALVMYWTVASAIVFVLGAVVKSVTIRGFVYALFVIQLPIVAWIEFVPHEWRPTSMTWPFVNFDTLPTLGFACLLMAIGAVLTRGIGDISKEEKTGGLYIGAIGIFYCWLLLSFETYRYFTGMDLFGPGFWTARIALSILWMVFIAILLVVGIRRRSMAIRMIAMVLVYILCAKMLLYELDSHDAAFVIPFLNPYAAATLGVSAFVMIAASFAAHGVRRESERPENLNRLEQLEMERNAWRFLGFAGLFILWITSSIDVTETMRRFGSVENPDQRILVAQMSLSVLWSCFAGVMLAVGFVKRSAALRWLAILLFGITTVKVLCVDMCQVDQIWRVAAFFALAIVLAGAAAGYQRFRPEPPKK